MHPAHNNNSKTTNSGTDVAIHSTACQSAFPPEEKKPQQTKPKNCPKSPRRYLIHLLLL